MIELLLPFPLPLMISSGFLPTGNLLKTLINISNDVVSMEKLPFVQVKNISIMIRRIKILSSLFEEIQETSSSTTALPPSSILCFTELFSVTRKVKLLVESCKESSSLWNLMQTELVSNQFNALMKEMEKALDILPLRLLNVTVDTKEQVELLRKQAKRADLFVDPREIQKRDELLQLMATNYNKNSKNKGVIDIRRVRDSFNSIGLRSSSDYEEEISKLEREAEKQAGTGGLIAVSNINSLISLISSTKTAILEEEHLMIKQNLKQPASVNVGPDQSSCSSVICNIPDEFRCPISLDLIRDPVIVASGHTYDRNSIAQWINSGHHTCPKSGQRLIHMALIPNYALKCLIHQWCQENNIPITEPTSSPSDSESSSSKIKKYDNAIDYISATKVATDAVKMTAEFLVGKLAMGSPDIQRQAAYELRLLAKTGMDNRRIIAESGAIPFLLTLLSSHDPRIQENAVTALLNLSIHENNKILIMSAGAIDSLIEVLQSGKTMEARENAAAAIFSLSVIDEYKVIIGSRAQAIPSLVGLLEEGTTAGKRDAAIALFNLAVYDANRPSIVQAGAVPLLIHLLMDDKAGITDDALAVLALLLGCNKGLHALRKSRILVPLLVDLLRFGSSKGKDHSITLLLGLCKDSGEDIAGKLLMNPRSIPSLQSLAADGSLRARRKAEALLRLLNRCCSQSQ